MKKKNLTVQQKLHGIIGRIAHTIKSTNANSNQSIGTGLFGILHNVHTKKIINLPLLRLYLQFTLVPPNTHLQTILFNDPLQLILIVRILLKDASAHHATPVPIHIKHHFTSS
ncbi:hypothetical protein TraAM80_06252 [Trypanosoma rangeli]|uniref:Uncharacterized protein n=1 Tax=Trypanosoma rangeli TaxID=5698 RepID=A0A3R7KAI1_TRYRA|nr:uncharacterized protein TraAM80_06252 [Trypanosoma rangeli]RNF02666.1 hypothetical protein TraAM80_06252 [Trypanosoma rangeli]|eukprot:RNF02666.1 hypothetical protein TraAM80_06252 [Trypanosoma rangeli]